MAHRPLLGVGIAEADVLEHEAARDRSRHGHRVGTRGDLRFNGEEREQVVQVQRLPGDLREADQQALQQLAQAQEAAGEEGQVTDAEVAADGAPGDVGVGDVVAQRAERGQQRAPQRAAAGQRPVGDVVAVGELAVAFNQEAVQVEDLHFLRGLDAGADLAQVVELAPLRRPLVVERIAQRVEVRFADKGRHQRHRQQRDQPRRVHQQADGEAGHGDGVLQLPEQLAHQVHPPHALPPCAVQAVLQFGVLEVLQVQQRGMLHQAHAGGVVEQLREQVVGIGHQPAKQVRADRQRQLQRQQRQQVVEPAAGQRVAEVVQARSATGQPDRLVDDQLADIQRGHRHQRAHQAQAEAGQGQAGAGLPDLAQERRQVAQGMEAFAQAGLARRCGGRTHASILAPGRGERNRGATISRRLPGRIRRSSPGRPGGRRHAPLRPAARTRRCHRRR